MTARETGFRSRSVNMGAPSPAPAGRLPMVLAVFGAMSMLLVISLMHMHRASHAMQLKHGQFEMLYNQWGTNDHNDHWGGVGRCAQA